MLTYCHSSKSMWQLSFQPNTLLQWMKLNVIYVYTPMLYLYVIIPNADLHKISMLYMGSAFLLRQSANLVLTFFNNHCYRE